MALRHDQIVLSFLDQRYVFELFDLSLIPPCLSPLEGGTWGGYPPHTPGNEPCRFYLLRSVPLRHRIPIPLARKIAYEALGQIVEEGAGAGVLLVGPQVRPVGGAHQRVERSRAVRPIEKIVLSVAV